MRWIGLSVLVIIFAAVVCVPITGAETLPDYEKNLQIHLNYQDSRYSVSSLEVRYGKAPNLNIKSGILKGVILDTNGRELKTFSLQEPGVAYGDILGPTEGDSLIGYTGRSAFGDMIITLPYLQDMQKFSLSDSRDGSLLVSTDLNLPVTAFCTDYPGDPDCLMRIPSSKSPVTDSDMYLVLAALLSASIIIAGVIAILTIRRRTKEETYEKRVVLIVDDEPDIVSLIDILLDKKGYGTLKAYGGKECLDILKKQIPDLILLDVRMEPMDGWQTLEQIKKNPDFKSIPVLMLTGTRFTAAAAKQYQIFMDDYIMKPFQPLDLYAAIDHILTRKQKVKESLVLATQAGVDKDMFCEFAKLTHRISINKKIIDILQVPQVKPMLADLDTLDNMSVIDYMTIKTRDHENRVQQLRGEINTAFRLKGLPEISW